ncbi:MAG: hypothetical protein CM15mP120_00680 [Pseudomonadota bacterium]|nr:MAG: hypothetical protein CM15mP120_00680 [Pseudomonadota bacterium]
MIAAGYLANGARFTSLPAKRRPATPPPSAKGQFGASAFLCPLTCQNPRGIEAFAAALNAQKDHLDILVNNAGVAWGAPLEEFPEIGWDKVMDTNVKGVFF